MAYMLESVKDNNRLVSPIFLKNGIVSVCDIPKFLNYCISRRKRKDEETTIGVRFGTTRN